MQYYSINAFESVIILFISKWNIIILENFKFNKIGMEHEAKSSANAVPKVKAS